MNTDEKIALYKKQGYWPVPWRHHAKEIKKVFREGGFRPIGKQCFRNTQMFVITAKNLSGRGLIDEVSVEYVEGIAVNVIPFQHSWLRVGGVDIDITLVEGTTLLTEHHHVVSTQEVARRAVERGHWAAVRPMDMERHYLRSLGMSDSHVNRTLGMEQ